MTPEELEKIVKANQLSLGRIEIQVEKIRHKLLWSQIGGIIKIFLIIVPIIIGIFYLTPMLEKTLGGSFGSIFKGLQVYTGNLDSLADPTGNAINLPAGGYSQSDLANRLLQDFCNPELRDIYEKNLCK